MVGVLLLVERQLMLVVYIALVELRLVLVADLCLGPGRK
jgi:hypothetical protein